MAKRQDTISLENALIKQTKAETKEKVIPLKAALNESKKVAKVKVANYKKEVIADMVACAKNMAIAQGCKDEITEQIVMDAILKSKKICQEQI
mgnify:CR=1 FL=1